MATATQTTFNAGAGYYRWFHARFAAGKHGRIDIDKVQKKDSGNYSVEVTVGNNKYIRSVVLKVRSKFYQKLLFFLRKEFNFNLLVHASCITTI